MALCTSCGNQVEEWASFCTSCGKPMPAAAHPSAAVMVARPVCSSCGAATDPGSIFCTECGQRLDVEPAPVAEAAPAVANAVPPSGEGASATSPTAFCTNCGSKMEHGTGFCTNCGQPTTSSSVAASEPATNVATSGLTLEATQPVITNPINATPAFSPVPPLVEDQTEHRPVVRLQSIQLQFSQLQSNQVQSKQL
jgi:predicted amidophosphoribosyltransferase